MNQHRGCVGVGGWTGTGGGLGPRAVLVPGAGPAPGLELLWDSSGTGMGPGVPGLCREPGPAPALGLLPMGAPCQCPWVGGRGVLPGLSLSPGPVAMGAWPVGGYQPQEPVAMGAPRGGLTGTGSHGSHQPWVLTGVWEQQDFPHTPGCTCRDLPVLPPSSHPCECCHSRGLLALAVV